MQTEHISTVTTKADSDRQIIYAEVYAPYRLDNQSEFMSPEDIELMAHRYMSLKLDETIDVRHNNRAIKARPIESFIARKGDPDFTEGAWVLGLKIDDTTAWDAIKKGELNGLSFQSIVTEVAVDVDIETQRDHVGLTEKSDEHEHAYFVSVDESGKIVAGRTSRAADGHYHEISKASRTTEAGGHSHRYFL